MSQNLLFGSLTPSGAEFSPCQTYRYRLWRSWTWSPLALWCMLNPSTADASEDDATIRRVITFSRRWGFGAAMIVNAFGLRSTNPLKLNVVADPIGPDNDRHIIEAAAAADVKIVAWGTHGARFGRDKEVLKLLGANVKCLGINADGTPKHPLYLGRETVLQPYE